VRREDVERLLVLADEARLSGPDAASWVERLAPKRPEFLEAARFLVDNGEWEAAVGMAANLWRLWLLVGDVAGGRQFLATVLDVDGQPKPSPARALALYGDGLLAFRAGAQTESETRNGQALQAAQAIGDRDAEALALVGLSRVALRNGDYARVQSLAAEARRLTRDRDPAAGAAPLHLLAAGTRLAGDYDRAVELYAESLELSRSLGDSRGIGMELLNMGHVELHRGNVAEANRCFTESAAIRNQDDPYEAAMTHLSQAALAVAHGERDRATDLLQRMLSTLDRAGIVLDPDDAFEVKWLGDQVGGGSSARTSH
jgi:non-specific serine/threonine protein kinase